MVEQVIDENAVFRMALDSCPDLVFVKSDDLKITYANQAMLELYPVEQRRRILGTTTVENFTPAEAEVFLAADYETLETGQTRRIETIVDFKGDTRVFSTVKTRFVNQRGQPCILGVSTDVTLLVERGNRLRRTNEALERYASNVAHDLSSPLTTLTFIGELIRTDPDSHLSDDTMRRLSDGIGIVAGLASQVRALLLICKAEGSGTINRELVSLARTVDKVKLSLAAMLDAANGSIVCDTGVDIACHPALIESLMQNLVENSLKYRSPAPPRIVITHELVDGNDQISVTDNGLGMSSSGSDRVFEARHQLDPASAGTGLGLAMCRSIVDLHGGTIWVDESFDAGARVVFTLGVPHPGSRSTARTLIA